jgi:hypothetical protein
MGVDCTARIVAGWRLKDLFTIDEKVERIELYSETTGQKTGKIREISTETYTRFDGKVFIDPWDELENMPYDLIEDIDGAKLYKDFEFYHYYPEDEEECDWEDIVFGICLYKVRDDDCPLIQQIDINTLEEHRYLISDKLGLRPYDIYLVNDVSY